MKKIYTVLLLTVIIAMAGCGSKETGTADIQATQEPEAVADKEQADVPGTEGSDKAQAGEKDAGKAAEEQADVPGTEGSDKAQAGEKDAEKTAGQQVSEPAGSEDAEKTEPEPGLAGDDGNIDTAEGFDFGGEKYGVFVFSAKDSSSCDTALSKLNDAGFDASVIFTPDFSGLNPEPYYVVTAGMYDTGAEADACLEKVKKAGFGDAYVKSAGQYTGGRVYYTMYDASGIEVRLDRIVLHDVTVSLPFGDDSQTRTMDLYFDEDTVFDKNADLSGFGKYEKGDTPYDWFFRNYNLMKTDTDAYLAEGPALSGVFEVSLEGSRISAYHGSYWWD